jgi:hypothetical protein
MRHPAMRHVRHPEKTNGAYHVQCFLFSEGLALHVTPSVTRHAALRVTQTMPVRTPLCAPPGAHRCVHRARGRAIRGAFAPHVGQDRASTLNGRIEARSCVHPHVCTPLPAHTPAHTVHTGARAFRLPSAARLPNISWRKPAATRRTAGASSTLPKAGFFSPAN